MKHQRYESIGSLRKPIVLKKRRHGSTVTCYSFGYNDDANPCPSLQWLTCFLSLSPSLSLFFIEVKGGHSRHNSASLRSPGLLIHGGSQAPAPGSATHARGDLTSSGSHSRSPSGQGGATTSTPGGHYRRRSFDGEIRLTPEQEEARLAALALEKQRRAVGNHSSHSIKPSSHQNLLLCLYVTIVRQEVATELVLCADPVDFVAGLADLLKTRKDPVYQLECLSQLVFFVQKDGTIFTPRVPCLHLCDLSFGKIIIYS
jgi:hypothetical protein